MTPYVQDLDLAPDVLSLARRLPSAQGTSVLWSADGSGLSYLACGPIAIAQGLDPEPSLAIGAHGSSCNADASLSFPRWIGVVPYESFRNQERASSTGRTDRRVAPLHQQAIWQRYDAVLRVDQKVTALGESREAVERLVGQLQSTGRAPAQVSVQRSHTQDSDRDHRRRIEHAQQLILEGDLYLVNLARRFAFSVHGDDIDLLQRLAEQSRPPFGAYLHLGDSRVCSTSPELFLRLGADRSLLTSPIKGTRLRHADAAQDQAAVEQLSNDPKERAELAMVIDVERNDLGRVAEVGSVRVLGEPRVQPCGLVWHRLADVTARLDPQHGRDALLRAMAPSGSVTGAPKVRAMEVIADLEADRRGLYTGALGFIGHDGGLTLSMAIRTLTLSSQRGQAPGHPLTQPTTPCSEASYFAGGGIVADSVPGQEIEETEWKAQQLLQLCNPSG